MFVLQQMQNTDYY